MFKLNCFDLWCNEEKTGNIMTMIQELDHVLNGGITSGIITELSGSPGVGKTQLCKQLCINVQLPEMAGGLNGVALYIDTNQGFSPIRLKEMALSMQQRLSLLHTTNVNNLSSALTWETLLDNVNYIYCADYMELIASVIQIKHNLQRSQYSTNEKRVKLIVIDSFSYPVRYIEDIGLRTSIIYQILSELQEMALEFQLAVVITNELTTCNINNINQNNSFGNNGLHWYVSPTLGDTFQHKINQRLILSKELTTGCHVITIAKSSIAPKLSIRFKIKSGGVRSST